MAVDAPKPSTLDWQAKLDDLGGVRLAIMSGVFVNGSAGKLDLLIVGNVSAAKLKNFIKALEKKEGREINYSLMSYDEFYYRLSIRDKFISEITSSKHVVLRDEESLLTHQNK